MLYVSWWVYGVVCYGLGVVSSSVPESPWPLFSPSLLLLLTTVLVSCPTKRPFPLSKSLHSCSLGRCLCLVTLHSSLLKHCGEILARLPQTSYFRSISVRFSTQSDIANQLPDYLRLRTSRPTNEQRDGLRAVT